MAFSIFALLFITSQGILEHWNELRKTKLKKRYLFVTFHFAFIILPMISNRLLLITCLHILVSHSYDADCHSTHVCTPGCEPVGLTFLSVFVIYAPGSLFLLLLTYLSDYVLEGSEGTPFADCSHLKWIQQLILTSVASSQATSISNTYGG